MKYTSVHASVAFHLVHVSDSRRVLIARIFLVVIVTDLSLLLKTNILDSILVVATSRASERHVELPFFFKKDRKWRAENLPKLKFKQPL